VSNNNWKPGEGSDGFTFVLVLSFFFGSLVSSWTPETPVLSFVIGFFLVPVLVVFLEISDAIIRRIRREGFEVKNQLPKEDEMS